MEQMTIKAHIFHIPLLWLLFIYTSVFSQSSVAQKITTESEMILLITSIHNEETDSPNDSFNEIAPLLEIIESNNWSRAKLEALVLKSELLIYLNKLNDAEDILQEISRTFSLEINLNISIRINLVRLEILNNNVQTEKILNLHNTLLNQLRNTDNLVMRAKIHLSIGASLYMLDLYDGAIEQLTKGYQIYQTGNNQYGMVDALNSLANVYTELQDYEVAINYHFEALNFMQENNNYYAMAILEYNIAGNYLKMLRYPEAITHYNKAKTSGEKADFDAIGAFANHRLADIYLKEEKWQFAVELLLEAEDFYLKTDDKIFQFDAINAIIKAYTGLSDFINAEKYLTKSAELLIQLDLPKRQIMHNNVAAKFAYATHDYRLAFDILEKNLALTEINHVKQQEQEAQKLKIRFDTELIENRNASLLENGKLDTAIIAEQKKMMKIWVIVFLLAVLLIISITWALRSKVKDRDRFEQLAMTDPLTESPNRRAILEFAAQEFEKTQLNTEYKLVIGIVDLDKFKHFNDVYGHDVGDLVLQNFASASKRFLTKEDRFGRFGGEEWLFIFCNPPEGHISSIFKDIRTALSTKLIKGIPKDYDITFSMGTAQFDSAVDVNLRGLISRADQAMYRAKEQGRNRLVMDT